VFAPTGRARRVDGGFRLSGAWPWASGIEHCDWLVGGAFVEGDAPPHLHFFLLDATQFTWEDTWFNAGLRGTGSHTGVADDAFVPAHRVIGVERASEGLGPGVESNPNPLYRTPFPPPFGALCATVTLGTVRGAYEQFCDWTRDRASGTTGLGAAGRAPVQIALSQTAAQIDAAELLLARVIARSGDPDALDYRTRVTCRRDTGYASQMLVDAVDRLQRLGAARGLLDANPLQRAWRDAHAVASHILFNFDGIGERYGRLELGLEPPSLQIDPYF
jgi:3-hydroxy-9,10-secoandrosta-1,3,5(10)-triene-9,17-dione monooxygenase